MSKVTQNYRLYQLLKAGKAPSCVRKEVIAKELGVSIVSVPVYIHELKRLFKADIESVRDGREVVAYSLKNDLNVPQFRRGSVKPAGEKGATKPAKDATAPVADAEGTDITQVGEREMADIRTSLGIGTSFGRGHGSDY